MSPIESSFLVSLFGGFRFICTSSLQSSIMAVRYSFLVGRVMLFMLSFFDRAVLRGLSVSSEVSHMYIFLSNDGFLSISGVFSFASAISGESLWASIGWQEREASEMVGTSWSKKRDSRSLFTLPITTYSPLLRSYPTGGFFEICLDDSFSSFVFTRRS